MEGATLVRADGGGEGEGWRRAAQHDPHRQLRSLASMRPSSWAVGRRPCACAPLRVLLDCAAVAQNPLLSRLPRFRRGAFGLFLATVLTTMLLTDQPIAAQLVLDPGGVASGKGLWQPLTANFIFPDGRVALVFGTLMVQWFLAGYLEDFWGTRKYLTLVISAGVAGHVAAVLLALVIPAVAATPLGGSTPMDLSAVVAFGVLMGARPLALGGILSVTGRSFAIFIAALSVLSPLLRGAPWPVVVPGVVAMVVTLVVLTQPWRRLRKSGKLGGRSVGKRAGHLRVIRPDDELLN